MAHIIIDKLHEIMGNIWSFYNDNHKISRENNSVIHEWFYMYKSRQHSFTISVASYENWSISFDCLINSSCRLITKKLSGLSIAGLCAGKPAVTGGFSQTKANNAESVHSCHVVIMPQNMHVKQTLYHYLTENHNANFAIPDSKVHGAYMGPTWGWQDPGGPHVGPMNLAIRDHWWHQRLSLRQHMVSIMGIMTTFA